MGGTRFNVWCDRYLVETVTGTLGSVLQQFTHFPWVKPDPQRGEPGLVYLSLSQIAAVNPDVIFVQSYGEPLSGCLRSNRHWRSLKAVQAQRVFEIDQFWHWGNGTRLIRLMLKRLLPLIYPQALATPRPPSDMPQLPNSSCGLEG